jgi:hypothetical protein
MDNYELRPEPKVKRKSPIWNILTVVVLLGTCGLAYLFLKIFMDPSVLPSSLRPAALPTSYQTSTPTFTIIPLEPTWTFTATIQPSPSRTKAPTWTLIPEMITPTITETPTITPITDTLTITPTPMPAAAEITYQASTTVHADSACTWMGVGGKVLDVDGKPIFFQTIQLSGSLNGKPVNLIVISGHDTEDAYGPSGFEFVLGATPIASTHELWVQLFDNTGKPLTGKIYFDTFTDCHKNLVMVVFTKTR